MLRPKQKTTLLRGFYICARRESAPVNFLTEIACAPGLAVFAFRGLAAQTKTTLRPSPPDAHQAVGMLRLK